MPNNNQSNTNAGKVRQQNQQAAQGTTNQEFASETNAAAVRRKNAKAEQNKK